MATNLMEQMTPHLQRLARALVEVIPEGWSEATLRAEVSRSGEGTSITHSISSELHPNGVAVGNDELFLEVRELQLLCDGAGQPWSALVLRVEQSGAEWGVKLNFEYPD
jgi:hypothetical protein